MGRHRQSTAVLLRARSRIPWQPFALAIAQNQALDYPAVISVSPSYPPILHPLGTFSTSSTVGIHLPSLVSMSFTASHPSESNRPAKVAIPPLRRPSGRKQPPRAPRTDKLPRVQVACVSCRARKVRCNGGQPRCQTCLVTDETCIYRQSRKNRFKTSAASLS